MNSLLLSGAIGAAASVVVGWLSSQANVKTAKADTEGIYAKELPELLDQIKQLNIERASLSQQLLEVNGQNAQIIRENKALRTQITRLTSRVDELKEALKEKGVDTDED